ncbi:MAG TPA: hypothetical protein PK185_12115 [Cyclobacteriaceae bacterium]|nr:hypothetical protein [Cyclobacteriaceae bacterium]
MIKRFSIYLLYSFVIFSVGYLTSYILKDKVTDEVKNVMFLASSFFIQYLFIIKCYDLSRVRRIILWITAWIVSMIIGWGVLIHYGFDKKPNHADLNGLIAYLISAYLIYELHHYISRRMVDH